MEISAVFSVSRLINKIKHLLEGEFRRICVAGEISNLHQSTSGHWYFTLSDPQASIQGALFRGDALKNPIIKKLNNGDKIECHGFIGLYPKRGTFQIIARQISSIGKGNLQESLKQLKKKLAAEGLFDLEHKKTLPPFPKRIGVVTALGGAALQDFINVYKRRGYWMDLLLSSALVQGEKAPESLRQAYQKLIKYSLNAPEEKKLDVIVLTRGGGSLEDLWAFNDEVLAWDIFNSPIPTISAIGHQVDFSISDYVADHRCETPTAAAEVLTEAQYRLQEHFRRNFERLSYCAKNLLQNHRQRMIQSSPRIYIETLRQQLHHHELQLSRLNPISHQMKLIPIHEKRLQLDEMLGRLKRTPEVFYDNPSRRIDKIIELLSVLNPKQVLTRGYTYITDENDCIISRYNKFQNMAKKTTIKVYFHDGKGIVEKV